MQMNETNETDEKMNCGLSVAERDLLRAGLAGLADTVPPREVWQRIERQARAEGLFRPRVAAATRWFAGAGIAAAVVLAVLNIPTRAPVVDGGSTSFDATPAPSAAASQVRPNLSALMVQSAELERDLRALPVRPSVVQASTAASIEQIEYRIAQIDYYLIQPQVRMNPVQAEMYWRERVRLMNSLLSLRRAQAQRMAF